MRSRTTSRSRRQARNNAANRLGVWLVLFLFLATAPLGVAAEERGESEFIPLGGLTLDPIKDSLSASSWLAAQGLDPRLLASGAERDPVTGLDWAMAAGGGGTSADSGGLNQQVPFRNPAPAFSRNLIITRQVGLFPLQTEPHIAVDPFDPEHLVMGTIDYNFPAISTYVSFDGGETWEGPHQVRYFREDFTGAGDPVIAFDSLGNVYATMISIGIEEFTIGNLTSFAEVSSMIVAKSLDGGITWEEPISAARSTTSSLSQTDEEGRERGLITLSFLDKPWLAVGPNPNNPDQESIYLSYTNFDTTYGILYSDEVPYLSSPFTETTIRVVRSDDGGITWTDPIPVSPTVLQAEGASEESEGEYGGAAAIGVVPPNVAAQGGDPITQQQQAAQMESERTVQGSQPKVMADGTVVIAYLDTTNDGIQEGLATIMVVISKDGGRTYSQPIQAGILREPHFRTRSAFFRYWGAAFPQLAVGPNNEIYILATGLPPEKPTDDGDIYLFRSLDGGTTWEEPIKLNQDDTSRPQFFPSIAVSPDGNLHAMWGDMRDDPDEVRYHIYYSRSEDRGATWGFTLPDQDFTAPDTRVTDFPSNSLRGFPNGVFIGDYFSIAAADEDVYMVWADTRLGEFGGANQQIAFARQTAIQSPSIFLNPPQGSAGRDVAIQGFGFQPDSNVLLLVEGVTVTSNLRTDNQGQFQTNIYMPVTGEGPSDVRAFDETGNAATASFYTEFGFDTIQNTLNTINQQLGIDAPVGSQPPVGTPAATPDAVASPVASPVGSPVASSAGAAAVSSDTDAALGGFGAFGLVAGVFATTGALWWRRRAA